MASSARTSAGTVLSVGAMPAMEDPTYADFEGVDFIEVAEITNISEFSREYNLVTHNPLADRKTYKLKGSYNDGAFTVEMAADADDEGQKMIRDYLNRDDDMAVRVVTQDAARTFYMPVKVMSVPINIGGVDDITGSSVSLEVDGDVLDSADQPASGGGGTEPEGGS